MSQLGQTPRCVLRRLTCDIPPPSDLRQWPCFGHSGATFPWGVGLGGPGLALVVLSVVEQRLDAVRAVLDGADVVEVAARVGVHRATLHRWIARYLTGQLAGLADRSHRPDSSPGQVAEAVEVAVAEMRREHPRWGSRRIRLEMLRKPAAWASEALVVPSERTIDRILHRQGLLRARPRKRPKDSYVRFERPGPMQLWQMDIVGGIRLVSPLTGELREAKVVTAVDDHSRYCVIAKVAERATSRVVCLALAEALVRFGVPEEITTDNGKQFTDRFGKHGSRNGEVLFDKICRHNGITHRLTAPASPNQNGKVERFHGTFRPDLLDLAGPFISVPEAQAAVDTWVQHYNADRPHQALDEKVPVTPAERFARCPPPSGAWSVCGSRRPWRTLAPPGLLSLKPILRSLPRMWSGTAGRSSSTGWSRPAAIWRSLGASSGWARTGPGWWPGSGLTAT